MKQQVARLSPHQNGKVFGVLTAVVSLVFSVPFLLAFSAFAPTSTGGGPSAVMFLLVPVLYLIVGYVMVAIGCLIYNFMFRFIGGIEYDTASAPGG